MRKKTRKWASLEYDFQNDRLNIRIILHKYFGIITVIMALAHIRDIDP